METGAIRGGMLAGMSHPKLRRALVAMHEQPQQDWTLDALAALCGMSRSVFANSFRNTLGCTAGVYLQGWRISLAQQMLRKGQQLKLIADRVGYGSEAALSRAFKAHSGQTPRTWKLAQENPAMTTDTLAEHAKQVT
jgi:transcriptional regulator GlxA family with amidase domain